MNYAAKIIEASSRYNRDIIMNVGIRLRNLDTVCFYCFTISVPQDILSNLYFIRQIMSNISSDSTLNILLIIFIDYFNQNLIG